MDQLARADSSGGDEIACHTTGLIAAMALPTLAALPQGD
jgi:hypothetical protein